MRGGVGRGDVVQRILRNDQKSHLITKEDHDRTFLHHHDDDDQEYCHSKINDHDAEEVDHGCNIINVDDEPFDQEEDSMERTMYWDSQQALLEEILEQYKSSYSKLRAELSRHIELAKKSRFCECLAPNLDDCPNCLRRQVVNLLSKKGFNDATLCTSSWKRTHSIPGGKHEYIEVVVCTQGKKRKIKFLIEIEFRDEFKMAKACKEYQNLVERLPQTYIGKPDHLLAMLRVMCDAAKRSTAENKIHLGPWRKRSFMQMKWSASLSSSSTKLELKQEDADSAPPHLSTSVAGIALRVA